MAKERTYYGVYGVIDSKHQKQLTDLILSHKGKKFGQEKTILGIFGKAYYATQTALLFLQDRLKEPTCTYSLLILKGTQASLVKDAKLLVHELPPHCCMITQAVLQGLTDHDHQPSVEKWGPGTISSGDQTTLYTLQGCGNVMLDDEAATSLFDFSGVAPPEPQSDPHEPSSPPKEDLLPSPQPEEVPADPKPKEPSLTSEDMLEIASVNQIYSPPEPQQENQAEEGEIALEDDPEATEPPFTPDSIPSINIKIEDKPPVKQAVQPKSNPEPKPKTAPELKTTPESKPEPTSEIYPSPTVTQGYTMPHFPDPWHVRWRKDPTLFWGSIATGVIICFVLLLVAIPSKPVPEPELSIEEEERSLFDDQPLYPEKEQTPTYRTVLTTQEAKSKVLDLEETTFPQVPGPSTAFMEIISKPAGATVTINGKTLADKTPLTTFLVHANQKMTVVVRKSGHIKAERDVTVAEQQRRGLLFILTQE